ncbi:D-2-hydroxyacid dehydrogenase family protein [Paraburkholderia caribensis]|uniref:D-2-hydroxyacid dehydrogenase family protein n=1 Tax=Paraburkholderia caribensis TaxID=75105 RepID=UPI000722AC18|nr:D-2-hydroxyacid dehydrogenase family protein [Paraburkholderia caribensis]ALP68516.1 3-phosphoglycerate dehydrogenase [Paraburkholderia caribensis]AUT57871.1 3-phosphoglycerate dehydrogenase [Paraburkholderia caribensis]
MPISILKAPLNIAVIDDYQNAVRRLSTFSKLDGHDVTIVHDVLTDPAELAGRIRDSQVLVPIRERTVIDESFLERVPSLRLISQTGKGVAHIDVAACTRRGIAVAASAGNSYAPAELTWALVLAAARRLPAEVASAKAGRWQAGTIGVELRTRVLGIFGYGSIGRIVAQYGKAFGMRVLVWGRKASLEAAVSDGFEAAESKAAFFEQSDVITLHLRLSEATRGIVGAGDLARMKSDSILVNTSRAALIAPDELAAALRAGRPGFAAVDAYETEPAYDDPLFALENAICAPHLGYLERDTYEVFFGGAFDNILAFEAGNPTNLVNPEVLR